MRAPFEGPWRQSTLGKIASFGPQYGANARAIAPSGFKPRYVRITDIESTGSLRSNDIVEPDIESFDEYLLADGDLLFARSGNTVGKTFRYTRDNGPCVFAGYLIRFRLNQYLADSRYVYYFSQSDSYQRWLISKKRVAGQPNVNGSEYSSLPIPLPPLSEQRRIVELLDQADALRRARAEADKKAALIIPALFYEIFGEPSTNPKGWKFVSLKALGATVRYGLGQPPQTSESGVPLIRATNISCGTISSDNMIFIDPKDVPPGRNAFLTAEEVIVVRSGAYTGDAAQITKAWEGSVAGYDLVINPGTEIAPEFIEAYLLGPFIQKGYFNNLKSRAGQPHLNAQQLEDTPVIVVDKEEQLRFASAVGTLRSQRTQRDEMQFRINKLFSILLHSAFTGDLTATWREGRMKELLAEMEEQRRLLDAPPKKVAIPAVQTKKKGRKKSC